MLCALSRLLSLYSPAPLATRDDSTIQPHCPLIVGSALRMLRITDESHQSPVTSHESHPSTIYSRSLYPRLSPMAGTRSRPIHIHTPAYRH
eukprot:scaffold325075_cov53-Tisochrysis_lutea.AAC.1